MLKRRESIKNGRDSLPVCDDSDSDILVFDFVQNMTGYNFVRFHFDGLFVSDDETEDVAEPNAFDDLMLSKPAERIFKMESCEFLPGSDGDVLTFNALTSYLKSHNCGHAKGEESRNRRWNSALRANISGRGYTFQRKLATLLCYISKHAGTLASQSLHIPDSLISIAVNPKRSERLDRITLKNHVMQLENALVWCP